jgi:hypothetical protein
VIALLDEDQLGAGNPGCRVGGVLERDDCVVCTVGDQRRCGDVREWELLKPSVLVVLVVGPTRLAVLPRSDRCELLLESLKSVAVDPPVGCQCSSERRCPNRSG